MNVTACRPGGIEKAKPCSPPQLYEFAPRSPLAEANTELARYREYLFPLVLDLWGTATDEAFVKLIFDAAGGASLETFQAQLILKFKAPDANRISAREAQKHKPGLLKNLAEQAARTHQLAREVEKGRARKMPTVEPQKPPEPLDPARRWDRIRQALKARLTPESYENWFAYTSQAQETADSTTVVTRGDHEEVEFLTSEYTALLTKVCIEIGEPSLIHWKAGN